MATDYHIILAADIAPARVLDAIRAAVKVRESGRRIIADGVCLGVSRLEDFERNIFAGFGLDVAHVSVYIGDMKWGDHDAVERSVVAITAAVLSAIPGDAVLLIDCDTPLLRRRDGVIELLGSKPWQQLLAERFPEAKPT